LTRRRLVVNADDFGRTPGINRGIADAHRDGVVTSTTLMVNQAWSAQAARLSSALPRLGVGLHLIFCEGPPLARGVESLLAPGGLLERDLTRLERQLAPDDVEREARAQLIRFRALLGRDPTHLDSHKHVHAWPAVAERVAMLAREIGVPVRACSAEHAAALRAFGVRCPGRFIAEFYGAGHVDVATLAGLLRALPPGVSELMCHPGYDDAALAASTYRAARETELGTLRAAEIRTLIVEMGIELVTFASV
jgi:predicted glycoside hydrolase/deacetylase ChbG (UPF0249 family)